MSADSEQSDEQSKDQSQPSPPRVESEDSIEKPPPKSLAKSLETLPKPEFVRSPLTGSSTQYEAKDDGLIDQNFDHTVFSIFYNSVVALTDNTGRRYAQPFLRLPNKRFVVFLPIRLNH